MINYDRFLTRVWDKDQKKMIYPIVEWERADDINSFRDKTERKYFLIAVNNLNILGMTRGDYGEQNAEIIWTRFPFKNRFIPIRCAGLKDKNGELIYGGDILKYKREYAEDYCKDQLEFDVENLEWLIGGLNFSGDDTNKIIEIEVIGNRYENPELLEKKHDN